MTKDEQLNKEEADRRRDQVAKTMLKTPPKPHKDLKHSNPRRPPRANNSSDD